MNLTTLFEDHRGRDYTIKVMRAADDLNKIGKLTSSKEWGRKKYRPHSRNITVAAVSNGQIIGFATALNYTKKAKVLRLQADRAHENHPQLEEDLLRKLKETLGHLDVEEVSARATEGSSMAFTEVFGEPVGQKEYKLGKVNLYQHGFAQRPTQRVVARSGPLYKS